MTETARPSTRERIGTDRFASRLKNRRRKGGIVKYAGLLAIVAALATLGVLLFTIVSQGHTGFLQTRMALTVTYDPELIAPEGTTDPERLRDRQYQEILIRALEAAVGRDVPDEDERALSRLLSTAARYDLQDEVLENPGLIGTTRDAWVTTSSVVDMAHKRKIALDVPEDDRQLTDRQLEWFYELEEQDRLDTFFYWGFLTNSDSRSPELAGLWTGIVGSAMMLAIVLVFAFPIAVIAAVYLEEFAPKNRWTELIEININNLAAVPSIIFGLLGLAVFLNTLGMPRSSPLAGGAVLTLMTLPIIIIAARSALRSVPPSYRDGAIMLGASRQQAVFKTVLPQALPGMLTGTIIGLSQALGETAPLLLIGMIAFVASPPEAVTDTATALPVQIYLWANAPETGFAEKTQAAIMVLLAFLIVMNLTAIILRNRFQKRF
ncbi:MAG: phosphate ABC transporter permease PstA [Paracoccaceae bacterium]